MDTETPKSAEVLQFPEPRKPAPCGNCGKRVLPRFRGNSPAFCCYDCGREGQPQHAKAALVHARNG